MWWRRSREGAWIEMTKKQLALYIYNVAPVRERGLKFIIDNKAYMASGVAPVRERGLKYD